MTIAETLRSKVILIPKEISSTPMKVMLSSKLRMILSEIKFLAVIMEKKKSLHHLDESYVTSFHFNMIKKAMSRKLLAWMKNYSQHWDIMAALFQKQRMIKQGN